MTPGLSPKLSHDVQAALLDCGPFSSGNSLRAAFSDDRISTWRHRLPDANSSAERVEAIVDFLFHRQNDSGENGLALLLQVLGERTPPGDSCHQRLLALAEAVAEDSKEQVEELVQEPTGSATVPAYEIPVELQEQIAAGDVALFVGHRLSELAGLPGRGELAASLGKRMRETLPANSNNSGESLADMAELYEAARGRHALVTYLRDRLDTTLLQPGPVHHAIAQLPVRTIFCTTYDDLLDRALRRAGRRANKVTGEGTLPHAGSNRIQLVKLKGDIEMPESLVVTRSDLDQYALKRPLTLNQLRDRLSSTTFLLLGFDANDPDLRFLFEQSGYHGASGRLHYALIPSLSPLQKQVLRNRQIRALVVTIQAMPAWLEALVN